MKKQLFLLLLCITTTFVHALQKTECLEKSNSTHAALQEDELHETGKLRKHEIVSQEIVHELHANQKSSLSSPLSDHQTVTLTPNENNEFPLIFDSSQTSCINYQIDGQSVAQLVTGNENVRFESQSSHHFSFIQPLKTALLTIIAHNAQNKSNLTCSCLVFKGDRFTCTPQSTLTVNGTAQLEAHDTIQQQGTVHVAENVSLRTQYLDNSGSITAQNAQFNIDRKWHNSGNTIIGEGFTANALSTINTGLIEAQDLTLNTGIKISFLGVYRARNSKINALVGLNVASLSLPKLGSWRNIFTLNNAIRATDYVLLPILGPIDRMFYFLGKASYNAPGMVQSGTDLYKKVQNLSANAGASEWISTICDAKDVATSAMQSLSTIKGITSDIHNHDQGICVEHKVPEVIDTGTKIKQLATSAAKCAAKNVVLNVIGIQQTRDTLLDVHLGSGTLGVDGSSRNVCHINGGASLFANSCTVDTCAGTNAGILAAPDLTINATQAYHNAADAHLSGNNVSIKTASFQGDAQSDITANVTRIQTAAIDNQGTVNGSLQVHFTGDAQQFKNIGQVNACGGNFHYQGPIREEDDAHRLPTADELADGAGAWGHIARASALSIDANNCDVNFKKQHNMSHALTTKTKGNIHCDESLRSNKSIALQAQKSVDLKSVEATHNVHVSGATINAQSTIGYTVDGANYTDSLAQVHIKAGNKVVIEATQNANLAAVKTSSGQGGTTFIVGGKLTDRALHTTKYTEQQTEHETKKDTYKTAQISQHTSDGRITKHIGGMYEADAPVFDAKQTAIYHEGDAIIHDVHNTHTHATTYEKQKGWIKAGKTQSDQNSTSMSQGVQFKGEHNSLSSRTGNVTITNASGITSKTTISTAGKVTLLLGKNCSESSHASKGASIIWQFRKNHSEKNRQTVSELPANPGTIEIDAPEINIEHLRDQTLACIKILQENAHVHHDIFNIPDPDIVHDSKQGPTEAFSAVIAIAITSATGGTAAGATILSQMGSAALSSLCTEAVLALLNNEGNPIKAAKSLKKADTFKTIIKSALTVGLVGGAHQKLAQSGLKEVSAATNFTKRCARVLHRETARAGIKTVVDLTFNGNPQDSEGHKTILKRNALAFAASVVGTTLTSELGVQYGEGNINYAQHKAGHALAGAASGAILGSESGTLAGTLSGAAAGALGAVVGEITAEACAPDKPTHFYNREERKSYERSVRRTQKAAELVAATTALLSSQDVNIAHQTASTALEHNFYNSAMGGISENLNPVSEENSVYTKLDPESWPSKRDYDHHIKCLRKYATWLENNNDAHGQLARVKKELDYVNKREAHANFQKNNQKAFTQNNKQQQISQVQVENVESSSSSQNNAHQNLPLKPGEYIDADGNYYHQSSSSSVGPTVIKTLMNSQGQYETLEVPLAQPSAQNETTRIANSNAINQRLMHEEFLGGLTAGQQQAVDANDPEAFERATKKRNDFVAKNTALQSSQSKPNQNDPSQRSFWGFDEQYQEHLDNQEFKRRVANASSPEERKKLIEERVKQNVARKQEADAAEALKKKREQILDNLSAPPTKAQQQEMEIRHAIVNTIAITAAICEGGGPLAGALAEGAVVVSGSTLAAPIAIAAAGVTGGIIAYNAMHSEPEKNAEKDTAPPSEGSKSPQEQPAKNESAKGKYEGNDGKHHSNSKGNISKPPKDGQKALDNSIEISDKRRFGVENGKLVELRRQIKGAKPAEDIWHGYVIENPNLLDDSVKAILNKAKFINPKSGKVLIQ